MTTYLVFNRLKTLDQSKLDEYGALARNSFSGHPVEILVAYGAQKVLEGNAAEGTVIVAFPSEEAAMNWYDSPAYREARKVRAIGGEYQVTLIQGLS